MLDAGGMVIRHGQFYGPGTYHETTKPSARRIQVDDAARPTAPTINAAHGVIELVE